jgi:hypothetical protein
MKSGTDLKQSELLLGDGSESRVLSVSFQKFYNFSKENITRKRNLIQK